MRYLVVGDIHGVFYKLQQLEHLFSTVDKVIFCGDYVDRGPQPIEVLEFVGNIRNAVCLAGNHEFKYHKKIRKGNKVHPAEVPAEKADEFAKLLFKVVGDNCQFWYKDDNIAVSHAPAALYQHPWHLVPMDKFAYGWTIPLKKGEMGFPRRVTLAEKYPGEVSIKPIIYGHVHGEKIIVGENQYCVDRCCGQENGLLGAAIFEDSTFVEAFEI